MQTYREITVEAKRAIKRAAYGFARNINPYAHWLDVDDLCQEGSIGYITAKKDTDALIAAKRRMIDAIRESYPGGRHKFCAANIECSYDEKILETFLAPVKADQENDLQVRQVLEALPEKERTIVGLYYAGYTEKEIGKKIDLTESRICQIRKNIREKTYPRIMEIKTMARNLKDGVCASCKRTRPIYAKRLCPACYNRERIKARTPKADVDLGKEALKNTSPVFIANSVVFDVETWKRQLDDALAEAFRKGFQAGIEAGRDQMKKALTEYMSKVENGDIVCQ